MSNKVPAIFVEVEQLVAQFVGKTVRQYQGIPHLVGRTGVVEYAFVDEKGNLQCHMTGKWWCPASCLVVE